MSPPGYTYLCGLNYTDKKLQTLQDKDLVLSLEKNIRGGISSVMGDRYNKSNEHKSIFNIDTNNLYGPWMSQMLLYDENEKWHGHPGLYMNQLEKIMKTADDSDIGFFYRSWCKTLWFYKRKNKKPSILSSK